VPCVCNNAVLVNCNSAKMCMSSGISMGYGHKLCSHDLNITNYVQSKKIFAMWDPVHFHINVKLTIVHI